MDDDDSAFFAVLLKGLRGQAFARVRPLHVVKGDFLFFLPAGIENRGLQIGAARGVGIALRGYIEAAFLRRLQSQQSVAACTRIPMLVM